MIIVDEVHLSPEEHEELAELLKKEGEKRDNPYFDLSDLVKSVIAEYSSSDHMD